LTEAERRDLLARLLGAPGGSASVEANREFNGLWLRFVSALSSYGRQAVARESVGRTVRSRLAHCQVARAARDLAQNLSLHGYGVVHHAATELQASLERITNLLSDPEICTAFGANDMWRVIDQVNTLHLGGARDVARYRDLANAGTKLIDWLTDRGDQLRGPCLRLPEIGASTVDAAEQWLASSSGLRQR